MRIIDHVRVERSGPLRVSRRRLLAAGGALAASAAAYAAVGCGDGKRRTRPPTTSTAAPAIAPVVSRGGMLRVYNFDATVQDTLDPQEPVTAVAV